MARMAGSLLVLLASALIALGNPLCCLLGSGCCDSGALAKPAEAKRDCCAHCKSKAPGKPSPKPCEHKGCTCKHDIASHTTADHAPFVAVHDVPAAALPERVAADATAPVHRALPPSPARTTHPLLL